MSAGRFRVGLSILAIVLIALAMRLRAVALLPVDYDEPIYLRAAQHYSSALRNADLRELTHYRYNLEHPPLAKLVYGLPLLVVPQIPEVPEKPVDAPPPATLPDPHFRLARLTAALWGTLEVAVLAVLNPLAGLLLAVHSFTIKYTSQVMLEALPAFTSALAVVAYERSENRGSRRWLMLSAICLGVTAAGKYMYAVSGLAILTYSIWRYGLRRDNLIRMAGWGVVALLVFWLCDPFLWQDPLSRLMDSLFYSINYSQSSLVQRAGYPFWQPLVWLFTSVPWHKGVFLVSLDGLIALLGLFGLSRLWREHPVYVFWLGMGLLFLFLWNTKWPQYILLLTFPVSLAAANGLTVLVVEPFKRLWRENVWRPKFDIRQVKFGEFKHALLWLLPGIIVLAALALYPMVFQTAMAMTDFSAVSIRDGLNGGIWREFWAGITGKVQPVSGEFFSLGRTGSKNVHYTGPSVLLELMGGNATGLLVFEILWTVVAVGLQTGLGVGVALLLNQRGIRGRKVWQTLFILPWAVPEFVAGLMWTQIFDPKFGWLNLASQPYAVVASESGKGLIGMALSWQDNPNAAFFVLLIAALWYGFPFIMFATIGGLRMLDREVYDAAAIDGANARQMVLYVTLPMLMPLLVPAILLRGIFTFNQFYLFYVFNPPFPVTTFASASFFFFREAGQFALSAVINLFTVIVLVILLWWFNRWSKAVQGVTYV